MDVSWKTIHLVVLPLLEYYIHLSTLRMSIKRNTFNEQVCYILGYNCMKEKMLHKIA